uniref:Pet127-domain-containing protein n=1 Tax=Amorphochlora amoebiformis TaxID=1561963 RepID=A0A7S0DHA6_9EUKA
MSHLQGSDTTLQEPEPTPDKRVGSGETSIDRVLNARKSKIAQIELPTELFEPGNTRSTQPQKRKPKKPKIKFQGAKHGKSVTEASPSSPPDSNFSLPEPNTSLPLSPPWRKHLSLVFKGSPETRSPEKSEQKEIKNQIKANEPSKKDFQIISKQLEDVITGTGSANQYTINYPIFPAGTEDEWKQLVSRGVIDEISNSTVLSICTTIRTANIWKGIISAPKAGIRVTLRKNEHTSPPANYIRKIFSDKCSLKIAHKRPRTLEGKEVMSSFPSGVPVSQMTAIDLHHFDKDLKGRRHVVQNTLEVLYLLNQLNFPFADFMYKDKATKMALKKGLNLEDFLDGLRRKELHPFLNSRINDAMKNAIKMSEDEPERKKTESKQLPEIFHQDFGGVRHSSLDRAKVQDYEKEDSGLFVEAPLGEIADNPEISLFLIPKSSDETFQPSIPPPEQLVETSVPIDESNMQTEKVCEECGQIISMGTDSKTAVAKVEGQTYERKLDRIASAMTSSISNAHNFEALFGKYPTYSSPEDKKSTGNTVMPSTSNQIDSSEFQLLPSPIDSEIFDTNVQDCPSLPERIKQLEKPGRLHLTESIKELPDTKGGDIGEDGFSPKALFDPCHKAAIPPHWEKMYLPEEMHSKYITGFTPASRDEALQKISRDNNCKIMASTSSISSILMHLHFVLNGFRAPGLEMFSPVFASLPKRFTTTTRAPSQVILRNLGDGLWGLNSIPSGGTKNNLLMELGKSFEQQLCYSEEDFNQILLTNPETPTIPEPPDVFRYTRYGNLMLRSQLDTVKECENGEFYVYDIKTRAVNPIRMDIGNAAEYGTFLPETLLGAFRSVEREWYDMVRSNFLKYNFQCRIGQMDGVIVAFHNVKKVFGYQYITLDEIDTMLYGSSSVADFSFNASIAALNDALRKITSSFQNQENLILTVYGSDDNEATVYVECIPNDREARVQLARNIEITSKGGLVYRGKKMKFAGLEIEEAFKEKSNLVHWAKVDSMNEKEISDLEEELGMNTNRDRESMRLNDRKFELEGVLRRMEFEDDSTVLPESYYRSLARDGYLRSYRIQMGPYHNNKLCRDPPRTLFGCASDSIQAYYNFFGDTKVDVKGYHEKLKRKYEAESTKLRVKRTLPETKKVDRAHMPVQPTFVKESREEKPPEPQIDTSQNIKEIMMKYL